MRGIRVRQGWHSDRAKRQLGQIWRPTKKDRKREAHQAILEEDAATIAEYRRLAHDLPVLLIEDGFNRLQNLFHGRCVCCWVRRGNTRDHIVPVSLGGSNSIFNLQPLCRSCNETKADSLLVDYRPAGWMEKLGISLLDAV